MTRNPSFSHMDLISCRNVLIYLGPDLQKRVLPIFHYALEDPGFMLLGNAESVGLISRLFTVVDSKHKIYARKATSRRATIQSFKKAAEQIFGYQVEIECGRRTCRC